MMILMSLQKNQEKVLEDLESLKDKVRANGNGHD